MSDNQQQTPFDLEQVELKTDVQIHRESEPERATKSANKAWPVVLLLGFLALGGCGAAGYYYLQSEKIHEDFVQLQKEISDASDNLSATSGSLEETREALTKSQTAIKRMRTEIANGKNSIKKLQGEKAGLQKELSTARTNLEKEQKSAKAAVSKQQSLEATNKKVKADFEKLSQETQAEKAAHESKVNDLTTALSTSQEQLTQQAQAYRQQEQKLQKSIRDLESKIKRLNQQAASESEAGVAILKERGELKSANERLKVELAESAKKLSTANKRIKSLETVNLGDLVPYSDEVTPAQFRVSDPLPEGFKLPRSTGRVTAMALIDENGVVKKAYLVPGQPVEGIVARDIVTNLYTWKFKPAMRGNVRVKVWQPVLFEP